MAESWDDTWRRWERKTGLKAEPMTEDLAAELEAAGRSVQELIMLDAQDARYVRSQDRFVCGLDMLIELGPWPARG